MSKLGLTTGSSHIPFLSPPLSNLLCFLLPHDCRFLFAVCCFSLCSVFSSQSSLLFVGFYQLQSCASSLLFISPHTPSSFHVSRDLVKIFFSPFSPPLCPPSNIYLGLSIKFLIPPLLHRLVRLPGGLVHPCMSSLHRERKGKGSPVLLPTCSTSWDWCICLL